VNLILPAETAADVHARKPVSVARLGVSATAVSSVYPWVRPSAARRSRQAREPQLARSCFTSARTYRHEHELYDSDLWFKKATLEKLRSGPITG